MHAYICDQQLKVIYIPYYYPHQTDVQCAWLLSYKALNLLELAMHVLSNGLYNMIN